MARAERCALTPLAAYGRGKGWVERGGRDGAGWLRPLRQTLYVWASTAAVYVRRVANPQTSALRGMSLTHGVLHAAIGRHFIDRGTAPSIAELSRQFALDDAVVSEALRALADYHGVVLHPTSGEIWAMHPFSAAPTLFWVERLPRSPCRSRTVP